VTDRHDSPAPDRRRGHFSGHVRTWTGCTILETAASHVTGILQNIAAVMVLVILVVGMFDLEQTLARNFDVYLTMSPSSWHCGSVPAAKILLTKPRYPAQESATPPPTKVSHHRCESGSEAS